MFSTMMTAPSTRIPKSIAPIDSRLAGMRLQVEADEGEQQRQRNGDRDDQPGPHVVQEEDQDHDDQQHAAQQVALDRQRRLVDEVGAVVEGNDLHVLRQDAGVELLRSWPRRP